MHRSRPTADTRFQVELIKPSHYDDDGYVIQWVKAWIPSNSLATLYGLTLSASQARVLGAGVEIAVNAYDETNTVIPVERIIRQLRRNAGGGWCAWWGSSPTSFHAPWIWRDAFARPDSRWRSAASM